MGENMIKIPSSLAECSSWSCSQCGANKTVYCLYPGKQKSESGNV